jgi:hypothetical protein
MRSNGSDETDIPVESDSLETADAVARAAHIWIRSLCLNEMQEADERHALASGLVAGLCERLELSPRVRELVAYVYALLDDDGEQALAVSRKMLNPPVPFSRRLPYERGRSEARGIVEMLVYHDRNR